MPALYFKMMKNKKKSRAMQRNDEKHEITNRKWWAHFNVLEKIKPKT